MIARTFFNLLTVCTIVAISSTACLGQSGRQPFFISGYGDGIYFSSLSEDGQLTEPVLLAEQFNASFFCFHATKNNVLYAVTETMRNDPNHPAKIVAYRYDRQAAEQGQVPKLERLNSLAVDGDIPCHVTMDPTGRFLVVANYTNGSVVVFSTNEDGSLKEQTCNIVHQLVDGRPRSNGHCSVLSPDGKHVLVADLGLDRVFLYRLDLTNGTLQPGQQPFLKLADGAGPRHLAFHPNGRYLYIINETNLTMTCAQWDPATATLEVINTESTLPDDERQSGYSTAEVRVHPNGRFVYGSNRGHDTIVTMQIDPASGAIKRVANTSTLGQTPRNFRLTPDGKTLLAENQSSNSIYSFAIDPKTGKLTPTGHFINVKSPACIKFIAEQR